MAKAWFEPIVPKKPVIPKSLSTGAAKPTLTGVMRSLLNEYHRVAATYEVPPGKITRSKAKHGMTTKSGQKLKAGRTVTKGYVRTLTLKKSWSKRGPIQRGDAITGEVMSSGKIAPYNKLVRGLKKDQAKIHAAHGWKSVEDITKEVAPPYLEKAKKVIQGGD